jgi:hypothetical protein
MHDHGKGKSEIAAMTEKLKRLSLQIMAGVRMPIDKPIARVIRSLAEAGVFKNGGVLIGTQAFKAAGLVLGACWDNATMHTNDIDIATQLKLSVAIPNIKTDIPAVLDNLEMGFFAVPELTHNAPSTRFAIKGSQLRLDVLTPKTKESESSVYINRFKCGAQPLDYLSYIMESPIPAVLLDTMPVLINIPQPVRYAMHKLIVSQVRDMSGDAKRPKDLFQAYQILTVLQESRPFDILPAWEDLVRRGPKWKKYAKAGFVSMGKLFGKLDILGISGVLEG